MLNDSPEEKARLRHERAQVQREQVAARRTAQRDIRLQVAQDIVQTVLARYPDPDFVVLEGVWIGMQMLQGPDVAAQVLRDAQVVQSGDA
ncbi:MAG: hypothetical protein PHT19_13660 [Methylococcus sp.]|nr:hypothetical protein [Methylococcus sp.]